jgi:hypothetical protein
VTRFEDLDVEPDGGSHAGTWGAIAVCLLIAVAVWWLNTRPAPAPTERCVTYVDQDDGDRATICTTVP